MDSTITVALIGLIGTLAVALLGYRRWSAERRAGGEGPYREERRLLYSSLWQQMEAVNVDVRRASIPPSEFGERVADLNAFMIQNGLHIDNEHRVLVNEYLKAVHAFP